MGSGYVSMKNKEAEVDQLCLLLDEKEDILKSWISRYEAEIEKIQAGHKKKQRSLRQQITSLEANMSLMVSFHSKQNDENARLVQGQVIHHQFTQPIATSMHPQSAAASPRPPASASSGAKGALRMLSNVLKVRSASAPSSRHPSPSLSCPFASETMGMRAQDMPTQMPAAQEVEAMRQLNEHLSMLLLGLSPPKDATQSCLHMEQQRTLSKVGETNGTNGSLQDLEAARQGGQGERDLRHSVATSPDVSVRRATEPQLTVVRPLLAAARSPVHRASPHRPPRGDA